MPKAIQSYIQFNQNAFIFFQSNGTSIILITTICTEEPCGGGRIHPSEMAHMEERHTLMLTIFGNFTSTGENQELKIKDLNTPLMEQCKLC